MDTIENATGRTVGADHTTQVEGPTIIGRRKWVNDMLADIREHQVNREWQTIVLSPLPNARTLEAWLISCKMDRVTASGRSDDWNISTWVDAACDIKNTWDDLAFSGYGYETLDMKFGRALLKLIGDDRRNRTDQHERI